MKNYHPENVTNQTTKNVKRFLLEQQHNFLQRNYTCISQPYQPELKNNHIPNLTSKVTRKISTEVSQKAKVKYFKKPKPQESPNSHLLASLQQTNDLIEKSRLRRKSFSDLSEPLHNMLKFTARSRKKSKISEPNCQSLQDKKNYRQKNVKNAIDFPSSLSLTTLKITEPATSNQTELVKHTDKNCDLLSTSCQKKLPRQNSLTKAHQKYLLHKITENNSDLRHQLDDQQEHLQHRKDHRIENNLNLQHRQNLDKKNSKDVFDNNIQASHQESVEKSVTGKLTKIQYHLDNNLDDSLNLSINSRATAEKHKEKCNEDTKLEQALTLKKKNLERISSDELISKNYKSIKLKLHSRLSLFEEDLRKENRTNTNNYANHDVKSKNLSRHGVSNVPINHSSIDYKTFKSYRNRNFKSIDQDYTNFKQQEIKTLKEIRELKKSIEDLDSLIIEVQEKSDNISSKQCEVSNSGIFSRNSSRNSTTSKSGETTFFELTDLETDQRCDHK